MQSIQVAASEIWISIILVGILFLYRDEIEKNKITKYLLWSCILRLISDAVSWGFDGMQGVFWGCVTRMSNYLTFSSFELVSIVFSVFLWNTVKKENEKSSIVLKSYWALSGAAIAMYTAGAFCGWFYTFDENNLYSRGTLYPLTHLSSVLALLVVLWLLFRYSNRYSFNQKVLGWSYFLLMSGATIYEFMEFGLTLQTYAQTYSAIVAFLIGEIELRNSLVESRNDVEKLLFKNMSNLTEIMALNQQLREHQQQLSLAAEDAKNANKAKSDFLSRMSHDIRTPMNVIVGMTEIAEKHFENREKVKDCLEKINVEAVHLQTLINDVLDISAIESGKLSVNPEKIAVNDIIEKMNVSVRSMIEQKSIDYSFGQHDISHPYIFADGLRISQICLNLLSNAVKYTPAGGKVVFEVWQNKLDDADMVELNLVISDTGMGMDEEFMENMYTAFARGVDSRVNSIQGTGLGLAIVKQLTDLMDGRIEVDSVLNKGTVFYVALPVKIMDDEDAVENDDKHINLESINGSSILVVEDNDLNYEIVCELLSDYGINVSRAEHGAIALDKLVTSEPGTYDMVLMDMQMPVMNGIEATKAIRAYGREDLKTIPIVAMTANAFAEDARACREAGMNAHLTKPINIQYLLETVTEFIEI